MMKIKRYMILGLVLLLGLSACENDKNVFSDTPSIYIRGDAEQDAKADSVLFSFKKYDENLQTYDLNLMVYTTGSTFGEARSFELEVVDSLTNVSISDYTIGTLEIPANSYVAQIPIMVKRNINGLNLSQENARLTLRVKTNDNFEEGPEEYCTYTLVWCDYLIQPAWWTPYGFACYAGPFTQARYKFILDYYGDVDLFKLGMIDPGSGYTGDTNKLYAFITELIELLDEYNTAHPGSPYLNDNGEPLVFGADLTN